MIKLRRSKKFIEAFSGDYWQRWATALYCPEDLMDTLCLYRGAGFMDYIDINGELFRRLVDDLFTPLQRSGMTANAAPIDEI